MIKILKPIFLELGFNFKEFISQNQSFGLFERPTENVKKEYFITLEVPDLKTLLEQELINEIKQFEGFTDKPTFDKNTSLLITWRAASEEKIHENRQLLYEIEEDPYNFKKYVLSYTERELDAFIQEFEDSSLRDLATSLSNPDKFQEFKLNFNTQSSYSLLTKIFIKIPILKLNINHVNYQGLNELINLNEREDYLRTVVDTLNEEEVNDISLENLDSILEKLK